MKTILFSCLAVVAASSACLAQGQASNNITVVAYNYGNPSTAVCTFQARSIMNMITQTVKIGAQSSGAAAGKATLGSLTIVKNVDACSVLLLTQTVSGTPFSRVIITVNGPAESTTPLLLIRLTLAAISSITESDSEGFQVAEKVTIEAGTYQIQDQVTGLCRGWNFVKNISLDSDCSSLVVEQ